MTAALAIPDLLGTSPADLLPTDCHDSTPDEARQRAERLRAGIIRYSEMRQDIADAFACRDWLALDYDNWAEYVAGEFGNHLAQLGRAERREAVADLRGQGMSTRQISDATGIGQTQVRRDLAQVSPNGSPATVTGSDGKQHPASRPTPTPGPTGAALSPPADPGVTPECLGVDMDCGRPLPCPDHPTLDLGASPAPAVESPAPPVAPQEPDPTPKPGAGGDLRDHVLAVLRPDEDDAWGLDDICSRLPGFGEPGQVRPGEVREVLAALVEAGLAGTGRDSDGPYWWKTVPKPSPAGRELAAEQVRESKRRTTVANLRSVLLFLTSTAVAPAELAGQYVIALAEFTAADLRFAAETMAAIAALKEQ